jgi:hypothetical protein
MEEWAAAVASRLAFFGQSVPAGTPALRPFLLACLDLLEQAAARPRLAPLGDVLPGLCALARTAIAGDCDDRAVNAAAAAARELPGVCSAAASVPGRAVWLAAMAAQVPDEQGAAAVMLVNDLAAVDAGFPLQAWQAALSR